MSQFQCLVQQTSVPRQQFVETPIIQEVLRQGVARKSYLDFLSQAYHHVRHTAPLLGLAASRCGRSDAHYESALYKYIGEEHGHEAWILDDINALGGDAEAVRQGLPRFPCKIMVGHAYYLVDWISPYCLLGMVHVLEGMSVALADKAASSIRNSLQLNADRGLKYLTTHSELDADHTTFFEQLINGIASQHLPLVIDSARDFYRLYGAMFEDIDAYRGTANAA